MSKHARIEQMFEMRPSTSSVLYIGGTPVARTWDVPRHWKHLLPNLILSRTFVATRSYPFSLIRLHGENPRSIIQREKVDWILKWYRENRCLKWIRHRLQLKSWLANLEQTLSINVGTRRDFEQSFRECVRALQLISLQIAIFSCRIDVHFRLDRRHFRRSNFDNLFLFVLGWNRSVQIFAWNPLFLVLPLVEAWQFELNKLDKSHK